MELILISKIIRIFQTSDNFPVQSIPEPSFELGLFRKDNKMHANVSIFMNKSGGPAHPLQKEFPLIAKERKTTYEVVSS